MRIGQLDHRFVYAVRAPYAELKSMKRDGIGLIGFICALLMAESVV